MTADDTIGGGVNEQNTQRKRKQLLYLLIVNAYCVWKAQLIGTSVPVVKRRYELIDNPGVGDLVMEISSIWQREQDRIRIGYLLRTARERYPTPAGMTDEEYRAEYEGEDLPTEPVTYIRLLVDGTECRWTNCRFIRVVDEPGVFP